MPKPVLTTIASARDFFATELRSVLDRRGVQATPEAFEYLVRLLLRTIDSDNLFNRTADGKLESISAADLYAAYLQSPPEEKARILCRLGDVCLVLTGVFSASLSRKLVDEAYYYGMGGAAYAQVPRVGGVSQNPWLELSSKFRNFSHALWEMSERSGLQSNSDLLRLYDRWVQTGNDRIRELLSEKGILSVGTETKTRN
jgi:hypothetical protein